MRATTELFNFRRETQLYFVLGPMAVVLNLPIALLIVSSETLRARKEFIMIVGFCLVDATHGIVFVIVAFYRIRVLDEGRENEVTSRFFCNRLLSQSLSIVNDQLLPCLVLVNTVDRVIAVFKPIAYYKLSPNCAWMTIIFVFLQALFFYFISFVATLNDNAFDVPLLCYTYDSVDEEVYAILQTTRIVCVCTSILLYIPVTVKLFSYTKTQNGPLKTRLKQLKRMTITVALATSTDTVFILIPDVVLALNLFGLEQHAMFFYLLNLSKCTLNIFICVLRHKEIVETIRSRFKKIFKTRISTNETFTITTF